MRIDSHHHFWQFDQEQYPWIDETKRVLQRDYLPADLQPILSHANVDGVVSVQARQSLDETRWLLDLAAQHPFMSGVVGWVPLQSEAVAETLATFGSDSALKGIRHVVQDEPDDGFILGADFNRGIAQVTAADLVYDILIFSKHLTATIEFVDRHPHQSFVLDHIAKPTIQVKEFAQTWSDDIAELARRENVTCKFSGVATEIADPTWNVDTIRPYWDTVLNAFGPQRLMFGSDWPVSLLRCQYQEWVDAVKSLTGELSAAEQAGFWGGNACRVYRLDDSDA